MINYRKFKNGFVLFINLLVAIFHCLWLFPFVILLISGIGIGKVCEKIYIKLDKKWAAKIN